MFEVKFALHSGICPAQDPPTCNVIFQLQSDLIIEQRKHYHLVHSDVFRFTWGFWCELKQKQVETFSVYVLTNTSGPMQMNFRGENNTEEERLSHLPSSVDELKQHDV